jgi:penicillin-binding protein 2
MNNFDGRKYVLLVLMMSVGVIYSIRLFYMQVVDDYWTTRATAIAEKRVEITPPRSVIIDRYKKNIVSNRIYYNIMYTEDECKPFDTALFAKLVGWKFEQVKWRYWDIYKAQGRYKNKTNYRTFKKYAFVEELTNEELAKIAPYLSRFPGFHEEATSMRSYNYNSGANIFGYLSEVNEKDLDNDRFYKKADNIGKAGLEKYYEKEIRGRKGVQYIVTSALSEALQKYADGKYDTIAKQADDIVLGLDIELQTYGEKLMQNKRGCIVAIEPSSGEILSMISAPTYDPNLMVGKRNIGINYPKLVTDAQLPLFARPLAAEYPPGSIFKLIQALIGLQEGVITPESGFPCNKGLVGCHNHGFPGDVPKAVQYSCNPYFYQATRKIIQQGKKANFFEDAAYGLDRWQKYMHSFGMGEKPLTDVTGVKPGLIPNVAFYNKWYGEKGWAFSTIRSISIGQGEVKMTPLQMANLAVILANRGWYYPPHFVKSIGKKGPLPIYLQKKKTLVNARHFEPILEGMRRVVNESGGTGSKARLKDIIVCGKTGTVENRNAEDHSVFIAFAPKDNPKIAIAVFVENAGFGGTWAAPIARLMIEQYLNKKISDMAVEKRIVDAKFLGKR